MCIVKCFIFFRLSKNIHNLLLNSFVRKWLLSCIFCIWMFVNFARNSQKISADSQCCYIILFRYAVTVLFTLLINGDQNGRTLFSAQNIFQDCIVIAIGIRNKFVIKKRAEWTRNKYDWRLEIVIFFVHFFLVFRVKVNEQMAFGADGVGFE